MLLVMDVILVKGETVLLVHSAIHHVFLATDVFSVKIAMINVITFVLADVIRDVTVVMVFVMDVIRVVMLVNIHGLVLHVIVPVIIVMVVTSIVIMDNQTHAQIVM